MKIQAVLFDCDGVLLESERFLKEEIFEWLVKHYENFKINFEEFYVSTRGISFKDTIVYLNSLGVQVDNEFFNVCEEIFFTRYKDITIKMNNVDNVLEQLEHLPKAVCSNGVVKLYVDTLEHHGIKHHFNEFFGTETTKNLKPAPDMFLQAAAKLNIAIENCLVIDDSYLSGVPAGKASNAGAVVGFASDEYVKDYMMIDAGADYVIRDLIELPEIIKNLNS